MTLPLRDIVAKAIAEGIEQAVDLTPEGEDFSIDCHPLADKVIEELISAGWIDDGYHS